MISQYFVKQRWLIFISNLLSFAGKPFYQTLDDHISEEAGYVDNNSTLPIGSPARSSPHSQGSEGGERFSRKVFVGGLPPDIDEGKLLWNISNKLRVKCKLWCPDMNQYDICMRTINVKSKIMYETKENDASSTNFD